MGWIHWEGQWDQPLGNWDTSEHGLHEMGSTGGPIGQWYQTMVGWCAVAEMEEYNRIKMIDIEKFELKNRHPFEWICFSIWKRQYPEMANDKESLVSRNLFPVSFA